MKLEQKPTLVGCGSTHLLAANLLKVDETQKGPRLNHAPEALQSRPKRVRANLPESQSGFSSFGSTTFSSGPSTGYTIPS